MDWGHDGEDHGKNTFIEAFLAGVAGRALGVAGWGAPEYSIHSSVQCGVVTGVHTSEDLDGPTPGDE